MNDFVDGTLITVIFVMIANMIRQGVQISNLKVSLAEEKTRSKTVDDSHDKDLNELKITLREINTKMDQVILAYTDTKMMLNAEINRNRSEKREDS